MKFLRPYSNLCLYTLLILMCLYLYGCLEFESINQPSSVLPDATFTVFIEVIVTETGHSGPYFGTCLPLDWTIPGDTITCTGVYNEIITYDPNLALKQEALSPAPEGYYWWVGDGNAVDVEEGFVYSEIQIQTSGQLGLFSIDYMLGNSDEGLNQDRSDNHLIYIVDEYTPRGLRTVVQVDSVMLTWTAPVMTEGVVGYNVYRDGQLINTIPDEDTEYTDQDLVGGVFYYSVSAVYEDGQEHLTPYEVKGLIFSGGTGEPNDPYQIASAEQLVCIADFPTLTDESFVLINNIDLDPNLMGEAAFERSVIPRFSGTFDGNGFVISNLSLTGFGHLGLIDTIEDDGLVQNLGVINANITGSRDHIGIIAGYNNGTVSNSYSTGSVTGNDDVGGLVGRNNGSIATSYSTGSVTGYGNVGGLVGSNDGSITSSYSTGTVSGDNHIGGLVGKNGGSITTSYSTGTIYICSSNANVSHDYGSNVGGLAGGNDGSITSSYSTGSVCGDEDVGGLVGSNGGNITMSYSTGSVCGDEDVGGLVGDNKNGGSITSSFLDVQTSGLINMCGSQDNDATGCDDSFGKTTAEMQTAGTFLDAGWDFVGETENGTEDIWWIDESHDYSRLWWQYGQAFNPIPADGAKGISPLVILEWISVGPAMHHDIYLGQDRDQVTFATPATVGVYSGRQTTTETSYNPGTLDWGKTYFWRIDEVDETDPNSPWKGDIWTFTTKYLIKSPEPVDGIDEVMRLAILSWLPAEPNIQYDVYFGDDEQIIANATPQTPGVYFGRQSSEFTFYIPGILESDKTYYWRIDGIEQDNLANPWKGKVWNFTTGDFLLVLDDFETYDDKNNLIFRAWKDGWYEDANYPGNGTGSIVGNWETPYAECTIVHSGYQSMPIYYFNDGNMPYSNGGSLYYSEAERTWDMPQDWTIEEADTLTLYFRGKPDNNIEPLYVGIEDNTGYIAFVVHPNSDAVLATDWQKWHIDLNEVRAAGVDVSAVKKMYIGVGERDIQLPGGIGKIYVDDIRLTKRTP